MASALSFFFASAGVGQTGTLITIDHELQRAAKEHCIDAFTCVSQLRQQRNFMVQTDAQYVFIMIHCWKILSVETQK